MHEIVQELRERVRGEVRFDAFSRVLYSTDASIYEIEPMGVVIPRCEEDVQATLELAKAHAVPVIPRGGGTSLVGQCLGRGMVLDFSKYLNRILEVNAEERWARVQPGVVLDQLNQHVRQFGLFFGPDVATSNRANLGGLIANNSSGARSIAYGKTIDHVLELRVLFANAEQAQLRALTSAELEHLCGANGTDFLSRVCRAVAEIAQQNRDEVERRYPKILRRVGGYNLDAFIDSTDFNLARMIVGSEGTLAVVTEACLNLVPLPKHRVLAVLHFDDLFRALEAVNPILEFEPSAVELLDKLILDLTRGTQEYARRMTFVEGEPAALLLVEFQGDALSEVKDRLDKLVAHLKRHGIGYAHVKVVEEAAQANVWYIRKAGLGLLQGSKTQPRPVGFVEDTAVPTERLAEYIRRFDEIVRHHQTSACYYAHASVGCLHIRPLLNLTDRSDVQKMRSIAEAVSDLVLEYGGAMSAEHGDGLARSCFNEKMFGPKLYRAFKQIKAAFDPDNRLNPGKIVDAPLLTENLRSHSVGQPEPFETMLDFSREGGFRNAIEICNGNGVCRKRDSGTMCPSFMVTQEEEHSTRGRANLLRAVLTGRLDAEHLTSRRMYEALDLCLACKGCKGECPTNVDLAKIKYEFLYHYHQEHGVPLRDRLFAHIARLNRWGCATAPFSNWLLGFEPFRRALTWALGIAPERTLPRFARPTFRAWFEKRQSRRQASRKVVLFDDTFMNYHYPEVGQATVSLLEALGFEVILVEKSCCGRPLLSKGLLREARACAQTNLEKLWPYVERGLPIVGCEPSCLLTFRDEYRDLLPDSRAEQLAQNTFLIEEFLREAPESETLNLKQAATKFLLHGHCHMKALVGVARTVSLLELIPGAVVEVVDSGCCGMAGAFGFEKEHYELSLAIGRRRLFPAVEAKGAEWQIVAPGVSCRQQIEHATGRRVYHPAEVLAAHLQPNPPL